jgi:hypothetical protein
MIKIYLPPSKLAVVVSNRNLFKHWKSKYVNISRFFLYLPSYNLPGISVIKEMSDIHISTTNKTDGHDTCITEILLKVLLSMYNNI